MWKKQVSKSGKWILLWLTVLTIIGTEVDCEKKEDFQKDYKQSDVVTFNDANYSIFKVEKLAKYNFFQVKEDCEFVKVTLKTRERFWWKNLL